jgi:hypothetical protein
MIGMQAASFPEIELAWVAERVNRLAAPAPRRRRWLRRDAPDSTSLRPGGVPALRGRAVGGAA